jgi:Ca-activated chloride channel family protein
MKNLILSFVIALVLSLLVVLGASAQGPINITVTQVDQSRFPQVNVYVSVTDANGNPVRNMQPSAFRLEENGQPMAPTAITRAGEQGPVSTVLIIDHSGSMAAGGKMAGAKQAASTFVNFMRPGDRTALIQFDTEIDTLQTFTEDKNALLAAIQRIVPRGNTALYDALNQAAKYFETTQGRKAVIVVTDGMDNSSKLNREGMAQKASTSGFSIYTIGLGAKGAGYGSQEGIDEAVLHELATVSYGAYYYRPDASQLSDLYQQLSLLIQNEYKLTYTSPNALRDGVKRNIVVTAPGAASTRADFNPGGVIPEVESQWTSWLLFLIVLLLLVGLFFVPAGLQLARERGLAVPALPTPQMPQLAQKPKSSRVKLTGGTPTTTNATPTATTPRPRIKIKGTASEPTRSQLPWDEDTSKK